MKRTITLISLLFSCYIKAQLFTGAGGGIQNLGQNTYFNLAVSGLSQAQLNSTLGVQEVCISISHSNVEELYIYLESPTGTVVELAEGSSSYGSNFTNTCFNNNATTSITLAQPPYTGSYRPIGFLGRFQNGQTGNGNWQLIVKDYLAFVDSGYVVSWSINFSTSPAPPLVFTSSNLPIVVINTNNQLLSDSNTTVSMGIIYNGPSGQRNYITDPWNNYNGKAVMHFRGNSSRNFEKKPYSLETCNAFGQELDASLLGMPPESDWHLIAMYQDKSLIRVPITYDLARKMGHYAPRFKTVEVVINDEYRGVYSLIEKPKWGQYRINVPKISPFNNSLPEITGGYVFKIDRPIEAGWYSLFPGNSQTNSHFYYEYVYPKDTAITIQQKAYIKGFMDDFETVMDSPSFSDPVNGYAKYIDVGSFIDYFIVNELSKNVDAYRLSTYLYKDNIAQGGKLNIGPVWDYDLAWHNCNYGNSFDYTGWEYQLSDTLHPTPVWWQRLFQDPTFVNSLCYRWDQLRLNVLHLNNMNAYIDSTANALNESQQRNFIQWPILGAYIFPNPQNQLNASYQGEVNDLKTWIANRVAWIDAAMSNCATLGMKENNLDINMSVYPNPFESSTTFAVRLTEDADVSLTIIDIMGKEVVLLLNEIKQAGEFKIIFDRKETAAGIYFYQMKVNNAVRAGKIIIQ